MSLRDFIFLVNKHHGIIEFTNADTNQGFDLDKLVYFDPVFALNIHRDFEEVPLVYDNKTIGQARLRTPDNFADLENVLEEIGRRGCAEIFEKAKWIEEEMLHDSRTYQSLKAYTTRTNKLVEDQVVTPRKTFNEAIDFIYKYFKHFREERKRGVDIDQAYFNKISAYLNVFSYHYYRTLDFLNLMTQCIHEYNRFSLWTHFEKSSYRPHPYKPLHEMYKQAGIPPNQPEERAKFLMKRNPGITLHNNPVLREAASYGSRSAALNKLEEILAQQHAAGNQRLDFN